MSDSPNASIEFCYFDLGNILVSFDESVACENLSRQTKLPIDQIRERIYASGLQQRYERGQLDDEAYADLARQALGLSIDQLSTRDFLTAISDMFSPIESMVAAVQAMRRQTGRVGILSNTCDAHWRWIRNQDWRISGVEFDVTILSYQIGWMKPDVQIYDAAEQAAGVPPERILFIDDKDENVHAARQRGWQAAQCWGGPDACAALDRYMIR
ncbi:HAD family phosphatase [Roseiconus nitratireducens]|uniref:HAD family phosphatase n=1 Tax=Roseiconus nitratireducens TaxID=2605748 RepID=A0A5M6DIQ6_9BACT|nr:HAD family phosphatase [Roseiconus nitratireducens]KAA5546102.1 HAD family phosphatase [Roseiconus nitratireducens]